MGKETGTCMCFMWFMAMRVSAILSTQWIPVPPEIVKEKGKMASKLAFDGWNLSGWLRTLFPK